VFQDLAAWPPTARTMEQTRGYLNPPRKWLGERKVEFKDCTHTLEELKEVHREWGVKRLNQGGMDEWERDIIGKAVERSGGTVPSMTTDGDNSVAEEEGLYALGSDDGEEEEDVGLGPSRSTDLREFYMTPSLRVPEDDQAWHAEDGEIKSVVSKRIVAMHQSQSFIRNLCVPAETSSSLYVPRLQTGWQA
jgi:hypothetical protein